MATLNEGQIVALCQQLDAIECDQRRLEHRVARVRAILREYVRPARRAECGLDEESVDATQQVTGVVRQRTAPMHCEHCQLPYLGHVSPLGCIDDLVARLTRMLRAADQIRGESDGGAGWQALATELNDPVSVALLKRPVPR